MASGSESLLQITDAHPQAALSALARLELPFPIQNFLVQSLPSALRGLNGDYDPMRASGIASTGQQSSRFRKSVPSLRLRAGVPVSTGLCKRQAKPESGPRETGRRRSSEGNSRPACPLRRDFASAGRSPKAVPEKRVAAAAARETAVPTSPACRSRNEGSRSSEGNSSASQGRHPSSCPTSPACKHPSSCS